MEIEVALGLPPGVGDVTAVSAGFGLTGGGTAGDLTIAADPLVLQARVSGVCPLGAAVHGVRADGSVDCQPAVGGVFADLPLEVQRGADSVLITVAPGTVGTREIDLPAISNGDDGTLVAGETFLFGTGLFGSQGTRCLVTTVAQVFDLAAKTTNGPVLRIGSKHGTDAPADDGSFGVTFPAKPAGAISQPVSWTRLVSVPADGELLLLGCALASPGADWVGAYVVCNTTFVCF